VVIRPEQPADVEAIHAVHKSAFPTDAEAQLVGALRASGRLSVSLVAEQGGRVIGHVALSRVALGGAVGGLGLAPLAVATDCQRQGIGGALVRAGLATAAAGGAPFVVVLGHPGYYPRFGFQRAAAFGLANEYGADEAFMVVELRPDALPVGGGLVRYGPEFTPWSRHEQIAVGVEEGRESI
jgi:putative acetyltransferase